MSETAFLELMVVVITILVGLVSYFGKKYADKVVETIEDLSDTLEAHEERIEDNEEGVRVHDNLLYGKDNTPWDGFAEEVRVNRNHVSINRQHIKRHRELLEQEGMIRESDIESVEDLKPELD